MKMGPQPPECCASVPWTEVTPGDCHLNLICQRCHHCIRHCTCPPPELREQPGKSKRGKHESGQ
jgi:hypothetical protein